MFLWAFLDCEHFSDFPHFDDLDVLRSADQVLCWMSLTLSEVIFFTYLDWGCGFGEEDHRNKMPFSLHRIKGMYWPQVSWLMWTLATWLGRICPVSPLGYFSPSSHTICLWRGSHYAQPALQERGAMHHLLKGAMTT